MPHTLVHDRFAGVATDREQIQPALPWKFLLYIEFLFVALTMCTLRVLTSDMLTTCCAVEAHVNRRLGLLSSGLW
jgi:hypothetical protein